MQSRRENPATASSSSAPSGADVAPTIPMANAGSSSAPQIAPSVRHRLGRLTRHLGLKVDLTSMVMSSVRGFLASLSLSRMFIGVLVLGLIVWGLLLLPVEQILKDFLLWLKHVGPWGPFIMAAAYIPLNILALPVSMLTLGGGYVYGLAVGFAADSIGSTAGATAAFLVGKTICRSYVLAKLKEYPQFQVIAHAISKSGFKIVLLLRLVPILPFNVLNYVLSVTPISVGSYMLASWLGCMPVTFAFVYLGTTIKDISEIGRPEAHLGAAHWWMLFSGLALTVLSTVLITRVAKDALEKAMEEHAASVPPQDVGTLGGLEAGSSRSSGCSGGGDSESPSIALSSKAPQLLPNLHSLHHHHSSTSIAGSTAATAASSPVKIGEREGREPSRSSLVRIEGSTMSPTNSAAD